MKILIKSCAISFSTLWFFCNIYLIGGIKPDCMADDSPPEDTFSYDHYIEIGFTRDVCVELGRLLHKYIPLTQENWFCHQLSQTRTSRLSCHGCRRWFRTEYPKLQDNVVNKALLMFKNFNDVVWQNNKISLLEDRETLRDRVGYFISILWEASVKSPDLYNEINRFGSLFCQNPAYPIAPLVTSNPVYYIYDVNENAEFVVGVLEKTNKPVLAQFSSDDCKDCEIQAPILETVIRKFQGQVYLAQVNLSMTGRSIEKQYKIETLPTIITFINGGMYVRYTGIQKEFVLHQLISRTLKQRDSMNL